MLRAYRDLPTGVHLLCIGMFVNRAGSFVIPFLALYLSKALGFSTQYSTVVIGAYGVGSLVASLIGGVLADRVGRKPVMLFALTAGAAVLVCFPLFRSELSVLLGVLGFALVIDMYRPASSAALSDLVSPELRPRAFALYYVAINLGFTVGAVLGGWFAEISFNLLFYVDAGTCLAFALLILLGLPETRPSEASRPDAARSGGRLEAVAHLARDRVYLGLLLATFFLACVFHQGMSTLPLVLAEQGIGPETYGRIVSVNGILIVTLQLPFASFLSRFDRGAVLAAGYFATAIGFGLTALASTVTLYVLTVVIWTLGEMMQAAFNSPIVSDLAPTAYRATYFGALSMSFAAGLMLGPPLGGFVLERWGGPSLWMACLALGSLAGLLILSLRPRLRAAAVGALEAGDA